MELLTNPFDTSTLEWAALPIRMVLGLIMLQAGFAKFHRGINGFGNWLSELGYPLPQPTARLVAAIEILGGIALIVGLFTHWVVIPLSVNMVVATYTNAVKLRLPFQGNENSQGYELDILIVAALITLFLCGAGPLSIDQLLMDTFSN
jgi:putative oxidoreductase